MPFETQETINHASGNWRARIVIDPEPIDPGDLFSPVCVIGTELEGKSAADLKALEVAYIRSVYDAGGPWAFIVESKCSHCGSWTESDSCWGFDTLASARDAAIEAMNHAATPKG